MPEQKTLKIRLRRSVIGRPKKQKLTVTALGFHRMHQVVEHKDTPQIRGMVRKVIHLVEVEEVNS